MGLFLEDSDLTLGIVLCSEDGGAGDEGIGSSLNHLVIHRFPNESVNGNERSYGNLRLEL